MSAYFAYKQETGIVNYGLTCKNPTTLINISIAEVAIPIITKEGLTTVKHQDSVESALRQRITIKNTKKLVSHLTNGDMIRRKWKNKYKLLTLAERTY